MTQIIEIRSRELLDSRGIPTLEVDVTLDDGSLGRAAVPSGASTGSQEALELRDGDPTRFLGKGVQKALQNIQQIIAPQLLHTQHWDQTSLDARLIELDGTPGKTRLGANAILGVSLAFAHARATHHKQPLYRSLGTAGTVLPVPLINVLNGGAHANNGLDIQEFMIVPWGAPTFREALRHACEVFQSLKSLLKKRGHSVAVGDEGGFAPRLSSHEEAIECILEAIHQAGFHTRRDFVLALDCASTEFYSDPTYHTACNSSTYTSEAWIEQLDTWCRQYPIFSIEDAMAEQDYAGWKTLNERLGDRIQLIGDDLFVTQARLLQQGIEQHWANAILIKLNQVGSVSETWETVRMAQEHGYQTIMSHRSGETEDTSIADLAVAWGAAQIKTGSVCRSERTAKYNRLLRIEEELGSSARYAGKTIQETYL